MSKNLVLRAAMAALLLTPTVVLADAAAYAQPAETSDAAAVVDAFHAALGRGDAAAAAALLADDAVIFEQGRAERSKAEYVGHHLPADTAFARTMRREVLRRTDVAGETLTVVASETRTTGTYKGKDINQLGAESMVLSLTSAGWRIVHVHWSLAAAK